MKLIATLVVAFLAVGLGSSQASATGFLGYGKWQSFTEEVDAGDAAVFAEFIDGSIEVTPDYARAKFRVTEVLKGEKEFKPEDEVVAGLFMTKPVAALRYLLVLRRPKRHEPNNGLEVWNPALCRPTLDLKPRFVTAEGRDFIKKMLKLPRQGVARLLLAYQHLDSKNSMVSEQAWHEFKQLPYKQLAELSGKVDRDELVRRIKLAESENPHGEYLQRLGLMGSSNREQRLRLYLRLLALNGSKADLPMLKAMVEREETNGYWETMFCYLQYGGEEALADVEREFLHNRELDSRQRRPTLNALRHHSWYTDTFSKPRLAKSFKPLLDDTAFRYEVISDLRVCQDWDSLPKVVALFHADPVANDTPDVYRRRTVAHYLLDCPLPEAARILKELEQIEPKAIEYAKQLP